MKHNTDLDGFQKIIQYQFNNIGLLKNALTHSSYANEKKTGNYKDNERLEFLGDAVLELTSSEFIYTGNPDMNEGKMTRLRASIVCEPTLAMCARQIHLQEYIMLGKGEDLTGGRTRDSIISDALEALIGAIYLDGGYQAMQNFVKKSFSRMIDQAIDGKLFSDYKSEVQEILQGKGKPVTIAYETDREEGPAHDKTFFVHLSCNGEIMGKGIGKSKKEAEQNAAKQTLEMLERRK